MPSTPDTRDELLAELVRATFAYEEADRAFMDHALGGLSGRLNRVVMAKQHLQNVRAELHRRYPEEF